MKRIISRLALAGVLTAVIAGVAASATAQDMKAPTNAAPAAATTAKKAKALPLTGKVAAVDKTAKTIKIGERSYQVTSATKITKAGKPAIFDDLTVGEEIGGQYTKTSEDKLDLLSLRIGAKAEPTPAKKDKPSSSAK